MPKEPVDLYTLRRIEAADPDGDENRTSAPTEADYDAHEQWAVKNFGRDAWDAYRVGGWDNDRYTDHL